MPFRDSLVSTPFKVLLFRGPFSPLISTSTTLQLFNKTRRSVAFKIQTTAQDCYTATPNEGIIEPGADINVTVYVTKYDPAVNYTHKFRVVSAMIPTSRVDFYNIWSNCPENIFHLDLPLYFDCPEQKLKLYKLLAARRAARQGARTFSSPKI